MKKFLLAVFSFVFFPPAFAQAPGSWTSADMYLGIRKLNVLGSVLYVAAHPDDENTRLITYLSKEKLYRTGYLSITRGDGGQNLIGEEQGIELGLIRTQELLAARRIDGGEQFFTRAYDFGYSKNPEETFSKWDKEKILSDVVWLIRRFQPDVIISRFPTTGEGGHGHHTASAILANEAFTAAADPNRFPEQLKYVKPWQAKRLLWNTFSFGGTNLTRPDQFRFDVGLYNPLLGKSYGEIAAASRSQHKSQGFGVAATRGEAFEHFTTIGGTAPVHDLMDGVELSWKRIEGGEAIEKMVNDLAASFDFLHPEKSVKGLVHIFKAMQQLPDGNWKTQKLKETLQLIEQCSGLFMEATSPTQFAIQSDSVRINFSLNNRLGVNAVLKKISVENFDTVISQTLTKNRNLNFGKTFFVPETKPITQPFWLQEKMEEGHFNVSDQQKVAQADADAAYTATLQINIEGEDFIFHKPVKHKFTDPVEGELYQPLVVVPPVTVRLSEKNILLPDDKPKQVNTSVRAYTESKQLKLNSETPGWLTSEHSSGVFGLLRNQEANTVLKFRKSGDKKSTSVSAPAHTDPAPVKVFATKAGSEHAYPYELRSIKYNHIPYIYYFEENIINAIPVDLKITGKKIGYIPGAGDKIPEALEQMGFEVNRLNEKEISRNPLDKFDAIITGVRAYNTTEWLGNYHDKLMKFVENGGNLIVQYNTSNFISTVKSKIGPYSFDITRTRITDENSPVVFLKPEHPVFNFPNKITQDDFRGWVQERSIYHAGNWDKNFETVLGMSDPGEKMEEGSLIIAKYGRGVFVYTGLVFFRQLPAGVPGAYRLLANIIALNSKKGF
jgi:LmbE family N-acetylglucosaminyl deacetylase